MFSWQFWSLSRSRLFSPKKKTRITGKAYVPVPTVVLIKPSPTPIPPPITPAGPPEITEVFPFYGKVGDAVIIQGKNFGQQKDLVFFNEVLTDQIQTWGNEKIIVFVPKGAASGKIKIKNAASPYSFIVFEKTTTCELIFKTTLEEKILGLKNCPLISKAKFIFSSSTNLSPLSITPLISPIPPLSSSFLKTAVKENLLEIEILPPENFLKENLLSVKLPFDKKLNLIAAELYRGQNLIPFFINPLSLNQ